VRPRARLRRSKPLKRGTPLCEAGDLVPLRFRRGADRDAPQRRAPCKLGRAPYLEPRFHAELQHGLSHLGLLGLLRQVTGCRWAPVAEASDKGSRAV
jgi:hypothetical protein